MFFIIFGCLEAQFPAHYWFLISSLLSHLLEKILSFSAHVAVCNFVVHENRFFFSVYGCSGKCNNE